MVKTRIMVVEDEWIIATSLREMLEGLDYDVCSVVFSGEDAVKKAEDERPDIILMDILLRGEMDGIEAAENISAFMNIPIVYLTSYTDDKTLQRAKETDPFGYIIKPFEKRELRIIIEMALYKHNMERKLKEKSRQLEELNKNLESKVRDEIEKGRRKEHMLIQQSKLAAMGEMMVAISHQWRQPLNVIGLLIQDLEEAYEFGEIDKQYIQNMSRESMAQLSFMSNTITDFYNFFKPNKDQVSFDVNQAIEDVISLVHVQLQSMDIYVRSTVVSDNTVGLGAATGLVIKGYPGEFQQVILNVLNNARDAILKKRQGGEFTTNSRGDIDITICRDNKKVIIKIKDNGQGIPETIIDRVFEPYFTTREDGIGIGLYMSKVIIESHMGGNLYVENTETGAMFTIEFRG
ncbi:response regulator [Candidatus Magnetobacterium casense]|uniref:histidine kinase n=1 Tax=Candidatus Magnetobacterium casense TaxID=1455061 RepID=A0ABS6RWU5_9BACT|nr:response regulator [Candidatus Magnetobacterium casensis]MBV6341097.1 response regulator [Candidatus Magnetobacterium casensis]